jgi:predicted acyl esterase
MGVPVGRKADRQTAGPTGALAGTLIPPEGEGPFPAVAILHGSGPDTRATYLPDATMLARAGVAALIYDKRGTGESFGDWNLLGTQL